MRADGLHLATIGHAREPWRHRFGWRHGVLALAAILILWHGVLVGTHVHAPTNGAAFAGATEDIGISRIAARHGSGDDPATCLLCREQACSGSYLASGAPTPAVPLLVHAAIPAPIAAAATRRCGAYAWRIRGPPPPLHIHD